MRQKSLDVMAQIGCRAIVDCLASGDDLESVARQFNVPVSVLRQALVECQFEMTLTSVDPPSPIDAPIEPTKTALSEVETRKQKLIETLEANQWNIKLVAKLIGVTRRTIYLRLKRWGIKRLKPKKTLKPGPAGL